MYLHSTTGAKVVTLTVTDTVSGLTASDTVTVTVHNAPVARAGSDQRVVVGSEVSFDGSRSCDPDGGNLTYLWDFGDRADPPTAKGVKPFCFYDDTGVKTATLTVTDDEGVTASDTVVITVVSPPGPLGVTVTGNPHTVFDGTKVEFEGSVENAPEDADLTYSWIFGKGAFYVNIAELTASCFYGIPGEKTVTLTVSYTDADNEKVEAEGTFVITVLKVDAGHYQVAAVGDRVEFEGSVENAPEGATLIYSWDFGEGATNAEDDDGLTPSCVYASAGKKAVTLTVRFTIDGVSGESSSTVMIAIPHLTVQGPRLLSPLEKDAVRLVFGGSSSFTDLKILNKIRIQFVWEIDGQPTWGASQGAGLIKIAIKKHPCTDFLDHNSTRGTVDIFKPSNMFYLNRLIHECTHWWQEDNDRYQYSTSGGLERYNFDFDELQDLTFPDKEPHASAAATWFVIGWQLTYRDVEVESMINLTQRGIGDRVGTVNRYSVIRDIPNAPSNSEYSGRWVTRQKAEALSSDFTTVLEELRRL